MRICLIGYHVTSPDEGIRNVTSYIAKELSKNHEVMKLNVRDMNSWRKIRPFHPQIIHYILSLAGITSFLVAKAIALYHREARTVMSAPHPNSFSSKRIISLLKPDLMLTQSQESEKMFSNLGCKTQFLPNGVDTEKFAPVSSGAKQKLREKYSVDKDKFVILHVGSIKEGRNIQLMGKMQRGNNQVIIIGRNSEIQERNVHRDLQEKGCITMTDYFQNLEEIYALSDCYLFPTMNRQYCIELPLSVLEAMSCNLPVISARFGALADVFGEMDGLIFAEKEEDFLDGIEKVKKGALEIKTREKILPYSWESIVKKLEEIYAQLIL